MLLRFCCQMPNRQSDESIDLYPSFPSFEDKQSMYCLSGVDRVIEMDSYRQFLSKAEEPDLEEILNLQVKCGGINPCIRD